MTYNLVVTADNSLARSQVPGKGPQELDLQGRSPSQPIYAYTQETVNDNVKLTIHKKYDSTRACVADLDKNRNKNTQTLLLRAKHGGLYKGYRVSLVPLNDDDVKR